MQQEQGTTATGKTQKGFPKPPFPEQELEYPGIESNLEPKPQYRADAYQGAAKLINKVALITGGDSGIGRAVAVLYAREGADIAIVYLPEEEADAQETKEAIEKEGRQCITIPGDVKDFDFCATAIKKTLDHFGHLEILVNNAAFQNHQESIEALTIEQWDLTFKTNIYGYFYMVKAAVPFLKEGSVIINTGSITGLHGSKGLLDYSSTKGAIHAFTKSLAQSLLERGIRVNCVAPGPVWTPLNPAERSAEEVAHFGEKVPFKRPAQPEEIAPSFVFLASPVDSTYITGEVITILGGEITAA
ncbi:MAG: SDR family oxidoreductase [Oligoflexus sp.]